MKKLAPGLLLLAGLVLPVVLFLSLTSRALLGGLMAAAVAIAAGWALNVGWAYTAQPVGEAPAEPKENYPAIATRFGWACPAVLVLVSWLVWHFLLGHAT